MKTYHAENGLRIVGKGYEVCWKLRRMLETASEPGEPLARSLAVAKRGKAEK